MAEIKLRNSKQKVKIPTVSKKVKPNLASLDSYSSTNALTSSLINTVNKLYEKQRHHKY